MAGPPARTEGGEREGADPAYHRAVIEAWAIPSSTDDGRVWAPDMWQPSPGPDSVQNGTEALSWNVNFAPGTVPSYWGHGPFRDAPAGWANRLLATADGQHYQWGSNVPVEGGLPAFLDDDDLTDPPRFGTSATALHLRHTWCRTTHETLIVTPMAPSTAADDLGSAVTNGGFLYLRQQITNHRAYPLSPSTARFGFAGATAVSPDWPRPGWTTIHYGTTTLSCPEGVEQGGMFSVAIPALPKQGDDHHFTCLLSDWDQAEALPGRSWKYLTWWPDAAAKVNFAIDVMGFAMDNCREVNAFTQKIPDDPFRNTDPGAPNNEQPWFSMMAANSALHSLRQNEYVVTGPRGDEYYFGEGNFGFLNTLDVAYEVETWHLAMEPWKTGLLLGQVLTETVTLGGTAHRFPLHDQGAWPPALAPDVTPGGHGVRVEGHDQAYRYLNGRMPVEEAADYAVIARAYQQRTGDSAFEAAAKEFLDSAEAMCGAGAITLDTYDSSFGSGFAARSTYDSPAAQALGSQAGNTVLTHKLGYANAVWDRPQEASAHFAAAAPHRLRVSSRDDLPGAGAAPGYLCEAFLYMGIVGLGSVDDQTLRLVVEAQMANSTLHWNQSTTFPARMVRLHSATDEAWASKQFTIDVFSSFVGRVRGGPVPWHNEAFKVGWSLARRSEGFYNGFVEMWLSTPAGNHVINPDGNPGFGWYPRGVVLFAKALY